jgi:Peptidase of plants and bacteria
MTHRSLIIASALFLLAPLMARAEVKVLIDHNADGDPAFKFQHAPQPVRHDAADQAYAEFSIVDGQSDPNGSNLRALNDGRLPEQEDDPGHNFFFTAGSDCGRLQVHLHNVIDIKQVNTYSWHPGARALQVYNLYAADGSAAHFNPKPKCGTDPEKCGWKLLAKVDTRQKFGDAGGQYAVSISDDSGSLGKYQYFLFDVFKTEDTDEFGHTFFSEIDVRAVKPAEAETPAGPNLQSRSAQFDWTLDVSQSPALKEWAETQLRPAVDKWYPIWVDSLASDGFTAPKKFTITIKPIDGVAATGGTDVEVSESWIRGQIKNPEWNEAVGSVMHELVHVVQQYGDQRNPGWLVEGIADYYRWFHFEPAEHRPKLSARRAARAKYSDSYQTTAGFLEFIAKNHDHEFVVKMNAALRQGRYGPELWKEFTGLSVQDLWSEYVKSLPESTRPPKTGAPAESSAAKPPEN